MKVAPSILAAAFANLAADVARVASVADLLHVDCMDGHYVPNLTIGPPVVKSLRKHTDLFLDCHLMVDNPGVLLAAFADAGADGCTIHIDGGIKTDNAHLAADAGVDIIVSGTGIFGAGDPVAAARAIGESGASGA